MLFDCRAHTKRDSVHIITAIQKTNPNSDRYNQLVKIMKLLSIQKITFASAFISGSLFCALSNAQTVNVNVSGNNYSVSYSAGAATNSAFQTSLASQVWFGNGTLAQQFATAVGTSLGTPNSAGGYLYGPLFAYTAPNGGSPNISGAYGYDAQLPGIDALIPLATASFNYAFASLIVPGPSAINTQQSLVNTAQVLQGTYALQNAVLANSFSYDCSVFGTNNICVSAGGRNTAVSAANGLNNSSALLIAAYRALPSVRLGAYADQNVSVSNAGSSVNLGNNTPLLGLFGVWNERLNGTGIEVKLSAAYGQKNTTINRSVVGAGATASEAGSGGSQLNSQGAQLTAKYGFGFMDQVVVSPYVGIRYTQNNMAGYTEGSSSTVTAPLTYSALNTNATTALAGVGANYRGIPQTNLFASVGVETDTNTANGSYSATGVAGLTPVNFNSDPVRTRPTAMLGASYDVEKNQRVGVTGIYRQEAYQATATTTVMATYTVGF